MLRFRTTKILEENIGSKISDIVHRNILSEIAPQARETKEKINLDYIKLKTICIAKETKTKRRHTEWENIFANDTSDKGLISKIYKELMKLNTNPSPQKI